ncbi:MAG: CPBP family intramembrane glutamic endopeptidase [Flavobacteriaceae bacterium]
MIFKIKNLYFSGFLLATIYYLVLFIQTWFLFTYVKLNFFELNIKVFILELIPYMLITFFSVLVAKKSSPAHIKSNFNVSSILLVIFLALMARIFVDPIFHVKEILKLRSIPKNVVSLEIPKLQYLLVFLKTVIIIPIIEEFFFRGIILNTLVSKNNKLIPSILFSSLLFSMVHINFTSINYDLLITAFVFGIFSGFIFIKWGLFFCILFHCMYNTLWLVLNIYRTTYWNVVREFDFNINYWLIILFSAVVILFFMKKALSEKIPEKKKTI